MSDDIELKAGTRLKDNRIDRRGRVVVLKNRINPMGEAVQPYWTVKNIKTGRVTVIREDRLRTRRWTLEGG